MIFPILLLTSSEITPTVSVDEAVSACRDQMVNGACSVEWRGAVLEMQSTGANSITVTSESGDPLRWGFSCRVDRVESTRGCSLQGGIKGSISINRIYLASGVVTNGVTWGGSKFPGSEKVAKIGNRAPMRWGSEDTIYGAQANRIIDAAKGGGYAIFRWFHWPDGAARDEEVNFENFGNVWSLFKAATSRP